MSNIDVMKHYDIHDHTRVAEQARRLQERADSLTAFRKNHSDALGAAIGVTRRNWLTFIGCCYMAYTDLQDGRQAKKAQKLMGVTTPLSNGAVEDPVADKIFRRAVMLGMETRAIHEDDTESLALLALKRRIDTQRDARMAEHREKALRFTDIGVGAIQTNRIKTAVEMAGMLIHVSPLANNRIVHRTALGVLGVSTAIGLIGERQYSDMVNERMYELAQACPDRLHDLEPVTHKPDLV